MGLYRKKPVVIEACRWEPEFGSGLKTYPTEWFTTAVRAGHISERQSDQGPYLIIATLEGEMTAVPGDWIIKGIKGELYPCKPDIFEATYEKAEE